jgi:hypothetical protein
MSFLSTPSSQSFCLSPNEPLQKQAKVAGQNLPDYSGKAMPSLLSPTKNAKKVPHTPNKMTKIQFPLNTFQSANK